ncbi:LOW QUALITY PROTEIN: hypothetical protein PHMEG_00023604 [Phytophthora megakarya]|uniref:Uncharacterized protein n=1 Tax=Phytophthora megakarya TaxID=4795 RepID=A0A225VI92_9STRA|nr:LOW QUALITY PROTEIN: hypothetical protein PHMEG_00023604 [Phytophthora megakarya]
MARVPGSLGGSGVHPESQGEVHVKTEQAYEMSSNERLELRIDRVLGGTLSTEVKPIWIPIQIWKRELNVCDMETTADPDSRQDSLKKAEPYSFIDPDKPTLYLPKDTQVS